MLTEKGRKQASEFARSFERESTKGMPRPEKWFTSPLKRTGETCGLEWRWCFSATVDRSTDSEDNADEPINVKGDTIASTNLKDDTEESADLGHGVRAIVIEVCISMT